MAIGIIALLAVYQSLEFLMCSLGLDYSFMAYLAFVDITFLPPLNMIFILNFFEYKTRFFKFIFLPAIVFVVYYSLVINQFEVVSCTVLYASYNYPLGTFYGVFFYLPLLASIILLIYPDQIGIKNLQKGEKKFLSKILLAGHLIISLPVVTAFILAFYNFHDLLKIIESIMCKFAFIYAICLSLFCLHRGRNKNE